MIPYKTKRGDAAMKRLSVLNKFNKYQKAFEGVPTEFQKKKKATISCALEAVCLKPHRKRMKLGHLSAIFGWPRGDIIEKLEKKRKANIFIKLYILDAHK